MRLRHIIATTCVAVSLLLSSNAMAKNELSGVTLSVVLDPTCPPFATLEPDYITVSGIDVDIIKELQNRLGFSLADNRIYPLIRNDQISRLKNNQADLIGGGLSASEERKSFMQFTPIYYDTGLSVLYNPQNKIIKSYSELRDKNVAVVDGSANVNYVKSTLPKANITEYPNFIAAFFAVVQGKADGLVYDRPVLEYYAKTMAKFKLKVGDDLFARDYCQLALGMPLDSAYAKYINREIQEMFYDGTITQIFNKYFK